MGSAKCVKGSTMPECNMEKKACSHSPKKKKSHMYRPKFYPCTKCGRKFTIRALAIHKQSCSENADCSCSACKSLPCSSSKDAVMEEVVNETESGKHCINSHNSVQQNELNSVLPVPSNGMCVSQSNTADENSSLMQLAFVVSQSQPYPTENSAFQNQEVTKVSGSAASPNFFVIDKNNEQCVSTDNASQFNGLLLLHDVGVLSLPGVRLESTTDSIVADNNMESHKLLNNNVIASQKIPPSLGEAKVEVISGPSSNYAFSDRKLLCNLCNVELPWEIFGNHIVQHSHSADGQPMKCPMCFKQFARSAMLLIHFNKHLTDCPFICKDCLSLFRLCDDLKSHTLNVHGYVETQPFHCYICMRRFSHPQTIINHMRLHSKETPFKCNECSRSFSQIGNLQRHLSVHRGDRPHKCQDCDKSFADPATLRNHVRIHTGETPFVCKVCFRGFTQVGNLKRHMARHLQTRPKGLISTLHRVVRPQSLLIEGNKLDELSESSTNCSPPGDLIAGVNKSGDSVPTDEVNRKSKKPATSEMQNAQTSSENIKVETCNVTKENETAIAMSQLKEQRKKHHWQLFPCPVCGKVYTWQHDLSIHFRIHTGEKPYKCDICDKRFAQSGAVRIHKSRHHSDEDVYVGS